MASVQKVNELAGVTPGSLATELFASQQPVLMKGLVDSWPSVHAARASDADFLDYLRRFAAERDVLAFRGKPGHTGRYFYDEEFTGLNFDRVTASLATVLGQFEADVEETPPTYIGSTLVDAYFPGFREENDLDLGDREPLVSIWIGNPSRIAAHFDSPENIACVVSGRRRFTLFPPEQLANLYVGPLDFTPAGQAISLVDFANPDFDRYPRFREALEAATVVEMEPGDALYLPSMWWHHVEGLSPVNALVNYWWSAGEGVTGNPVDAMIHSLLSIRGLPEAQRESWRRLFNHYVFGDESSDFSHIPEHARGVLGELDETMLRQLRAVLKKKLG